MPEMLALLILPTRRLVEGLVPAGVLLSWKKPGPRGWLSRPFNSTALPLELKLASVSTIRPNRLRNADETAPRPLTKLRAYRPLLRATARPEHSLSPWNPEKPAE